MDLSETRRFNWRTFLPYMRGTVDAEQWHQVVCSVEKKCPAGLAMAVPFWQPLQTDKLYVWVAIVHKCMCMRYRCMARNLTDSFLYAWIWVKPDGLIEELFYLTWGERLVQSSGIKWYVQSKRSVQLAWPWQCHSDSHCRLISYMYGWQLYVSVYALSVHGPKINRFLSIYTHGFEWNQTV